MFSILLATMLAAAPVPPESSPAAPAAPPPPRIYVGVHLEDVSGFDLKEGRFQADLQLWAKWAGSAEPPPIEIANAEIGSREEIARESDGAWHGIRWRIQGTFRGNFPLQRFPFDTQRLPIELRLDERHGRLLPDLAASGMADRFSITGWLYEPWFSASVRESTLKSDLGSVAEEGLPTRQRSVLFSVELRRPIAAYLVKFVVPLAIILTMAVLAGFLPPSDIEVRSGIGITALLSCVAFHFSQADSLPEVSYLVAADKLFLGAYVLILATFTETIVAYNLHDRRAADMARLDRISTVLVPLIAIVGVSWLSITSRNAPAGETRAAAAILPQTTPAPPPAGRAELRVGVSSLGGLNSNGIHALLRRGLVVTEGVDRRRPHLVVEAPDMTNEHVRFLPDGGMRVRWRLKAGLRWSDGAPVTADDIAYSAGLFESPARRSVTVVDPRTVDVEYANRVPDYLRGFPVYPRAAVAPLFEKGGREAFLDFLRTDAPPGDGPYVLVSFEPKVRAVFRRNPHFSGPRPAFETITVIALESSEVAGAALAAGTVDVVPSLAISGRPAVTGRPELVLGVVPADSFTFLQPDVTRPPFDRKDVRRAALMALDRSAIAPLIYGDEAEVAHSYRGSAAADAAVDLLRHPHDPAAARRLLAGKRPAVTLYSPELDPGMPAHAAITRIVSDLRAVGFEAEWKPVAKTVPLFSAGDHGGLLYYTRRDPIGVAPYWNVPLENGRWQIEKTRGPLTSVLDVYHRHESTLFDERRAIVSRRLQERWAEELPILPLAHGAATSAWRAAVEGPEPLPDTSLFWNVERWRDAPATVAEESAADSAAEPAP